jgi:hypothetical protein
MKFDSVAEHLKIMLGHRETVQCFVGYILNLPATQTDEMVMERHIRVKARAFMPDVYLSHEPISLKHAQCVIHGIA